MTFKTCLDQHPSVENLGFAIVSDVLKHHGSSLKWRIAYSRNNKSEIRGGPLWGIYVGK